jgi:DNA-binding response OmpR family regulator
MKRVLIVEDQADVRELIRMTLELEDLDIHEADNGDAGWDAARSLRPDLILLDVMMPGSLDGFEVCRRVRADDALKRVKVVMLTARSQEADQREGVRSGANDYLTKPFSPRELLGVVKRLLK